MTESFKKEIEDGKYRLKIGKQVPEDDVNICYLDTPPLKSTENVYLTDLSEGIAENSWGASSKERTMYSGEDGKLYNESFTVDSVPTEDVLVTDIYMDQDNLNGPLYYKYNLLYEHRDYTTEVTDNINILKEDGSKVSKERYKIEYTKTAEATYEVTLFLSFNSDENNTYRVEYDALNFDKIVKRDHTEILNAEKIFKETSISEVRDHSNIGKKIYAKKVDQETNGYNIYVPVKSSETEGSLHNKEINADLPLPFKYEVDISGFKRSEHKGIAVHFVIDKSGSMRGEDPWNPMRNAVRYFRDLENVDCKFNVTYFDNDVRTVYGGYVSPSTILGWNNPGMGGSTAFYDATNAAVSKMINYNNLPEDHSKTLKGWKKVIITMTDGHDNASSWRPHDVKNRADKNMDSLIYGIAFGGGADTGAVNAISHKHRSDSSLEQAFIEISEEVKPVPFSDRILVGSGLVSENNSPLKLRQLMLNITDDMMIDSVEITMNDTSNDVHTFFMNENNGNRVGTSFDGEDHSKIYAKDLLFFNDSKSSWEYDTDNRIYVYAETDKKTRIYSRQYDVKMKESKGIYARMPDIDNIFKNWYLEVHNGRFNTEVVSGDEIYSYNYYLPEYERQLSVTDGNNSIRVNQEIPEIIDRNQLKLAHKPLEVISERVDGKRNIKNITVKQDEQEIKIEDFNAEGGILFLKDNIDHTKDVRVSYSYTNEWYTYKGYYDEKRDKFVSLDLNPFDGHKYTKKLGNNTYVEEDTRDLFNKVIYLYLRPADTTKKRPGRPYEIVLGSKNDYTIFHTIGHKLSESDSMYSENVKELARIYLKPNSTQEDISVIDGRKRGGGLKETINQEVINQINPESNYYWDIGYLDGKAYPGNSVIIVKLPKEILKDYGGKFETQEVEEIIDEHIAYGSYFIIEYIDDEDFISDYEL